MIMTALIAVAILDLALLWMFRKNRSKPCDRMHVSDIAGPPPLEYRDIIVESEGEAALLRALQGGSIKVGNTVRVYSESRFDPKDGW